ncbi:DUF4339 domain-containing protein [Paenibacillaceae bacterium]|nr:DUF4339 domain-containing protein [Paenibacillaceae bacterium]
MTAIDTDEIVNICASFTGSGYFVGEQIPIKKLNNALAYFPVSLGEHPVIAFADGTLFGSGKKGFAIGFKGIYWVNSWRTSTNYNYLYWNDFAGVILRRLPYSIELGAGNYFELSSCSFGVEGRLFELLEQLQEYVCEALDIPKPASPAVMAPPPPPPPPPVSTAEWMVAIDGQQQGPYSIPSLEKMIAANQIQPYAAHVWRQGMPEWVPLRQQPELMFLAVIPPGSPATFVTQSSAASFFSDQARVTVSFDLSEEREERSSEREPVDVNRASQEQLLNLPSIGIVGAKRIIQERSSSGGFATVEEIGTLLGLKPHQVERLRPLTVFSPLNDRNPVGRIVDF